MNKLLTQIQPHPSKKISDMIRGKKGYINMTIGMPYFQPPTELLYALNEIVTNNKNHINRYADSKGLLALRTSISNRYNYKYGIKPEADKHILITNGCAEAIWLTIFTSTNFGDEIIIPNPCYMLYEAIITSLGRKAVKIDTSKNQFKLDSKSIIDKITSKTKLIIINTPCNPTGSVYSLETLKKIHDIAVQKNIYIMHDEVFDDFVYTKLQHISLLSISHDMQNVISVNSFSKRLGITGWRLGWMVAPEDFIIQATKAHTFNCLAVNSLIQEALAQTMNKESILKNTQNNALQLHKNINQFYLELQKIDWIKITKAPNAGMYIFPDITKLYKKIPNIYKNNSKSESVTNFLLNTCKIAVVPGTAFGSAGEGYIRISVAGSQLDLKEAANRLKTLRLS